MSYGLLTSYRLSMEVAGYKFSLKSDEFCSRVKLHKAEARLSDRRASGPADCPSWSHGANQCRNGTREGKREFRSGDVRLVARIDVFAEPRESESARVVADHLSQVF